MIALASEYPLCVAQYLRAPSLPFHKLAIPWRDTIGAKPDCQTAITESFRGFRPYPRSAEIASLPESQGDRFVIAFDDMLERDDVKDTQSRPPLALLLQPARTGFALRPRSLRHN